MQKKVETVQRCKGWIYLQHLLPREGDLFDADEDAEMEQVVFSS